MTSKWIFWLFANQSFETGNNQSFYTGQIVFGGIALGHSHPVLMTRSSWSRQLTNSRKRLSLNDTHWKLWNQKIRTAFSKVCRFISPKEVTGNTGLPGRIRKTVAIKRGLMPGNGGVKRGGRIFENRFKFYNALSSFHQNESFRSSPTLFRFDYWE